jgi:hypothetical protein
MCQRLPVSIQTRRVNRAYRKLPGRYNRPVLYIVSNLPAFVYLRADENNVGKLPCNLVVGVGLTPDAKPLVGKRARARARTHACAFSDRVMNVRSKKL